MIKWFIVIAIALLFTFCGNEPITNKTVIASKDEFIITLTGEQIKIAGIETGKSSTQNISSVLKLNGKIDVPPQSKVSVSVPLGGYLKKTNLLNGMHVNKGDVLAVMEDIQYIQLQQDYLTAKAQLELLLSEYNRQKDLNQSKATSDKVFEQTRSNYQVQIVLVKALEQKLKLIGINPFNLTSENISNNINIYSPITGFVSAVNVNIGKFVNPSDVMFELVNPEDIHLALTVFEKDVNKLSVGQKMLAFSNYSPENKHSCEIIIISKNLNNNSAEIHCHFEKYDKSLLPGMFMTAHVELITNNSITLPEEAIVRFENKNYIFIDKGDNTFEMQQINIGNTQNGFTEIITEQKMNQTYVLKGAYNLLMAMKNKGNK